MDWAECAPDAVNMDERGLARALEIVRARGGMAQLCVLRESHVVLDRSFGCGADSLFWIFSAGKPLTAMLVHLLAERGVLSLDTPVALYWPEFGRHGKSRITIRQVLQHRTRMPVAGSTVGDVLAMTHWRRSVRRIERARPNWLIGDAPAYQFLIYGFILGELVQRVTGKSIRQVMATELLEPLGMRNTYLGLPESVWARHIPIHIRARVRGGQIVQTALNRRAIRRAIIPAAGVSTTARDMALFYQMLLDGGEANGRSILQPETIAQARTPSSDGKLDRYARSPIRWSQGFQLGGPRALPGYLTPMGQLSSPQTFGHNGSNCCIAWADPTRKLVFAYLTNTLTFRRADLRHHASVADAVLSACKPL